jgi:hypothetical protein
MAPKSRYRLPGPARLIAQCALFIATGALLVSVGWGIWGVVCAVVGVTVFALSRRSA